MAVSEEDKETLKRLRTEIQQLATEPETVRVQEDVDSVDLTNIPALDLKLLCNPDFVIGIDFDAIDTSGDFTVLDMNTIAPGAIDVDELRKKITTGHVVYATAIEVIESQSGSMVVLDESILNSNIETIVESRTVSQGINLQMIEEGLRTNQEATSEYPIPSRFVGDK